MKKKVAILSVLFVMLFTTTVLARGQYLNQTLTLTNSTSGSSATGYNTSGTARVDVNTISDTAGCTKVKVFLMHTNTGKITMVYTLPARNTQLFDVEKDRNIKAVFQRSSSDAGTMTINYNFVYDL